jgi:hypothetical protein
VVFTLAFLSFACLLGQFYGAWTMQFFGCWVLPPATALLAYIAYRHRRQYPRLASPCTWIVTGAVGGVVAAVAYDLYRLPFVLGGAPVFKVFSRFGELLLGTSQPQWLVQTVGWTYHFSNGAALGIMFLTFASLGGGRALMWSAIAWALFIELMLLLTPYVTFFGLALTAGFFLLTLSAHFVFGLTLGTYCRARLKIDQVGYRNST